MPLLLPPPHPRLPWARQRLGLALTHCVLVWSSQQPRGIPLLGPQAPGGLMHGHRECRACPRALGFAFLRQSVPVAQ